MGSISDQQNKMIAQREFDLLTSSSIADPIGRYEVPLPINDDL